MQAKDQKFIANFSINIYFFKDMLSMNERWLLFEKVHCCCYAYLSLIKVKKWIRMLFCLTRCLQILKCNLVCSTKVSFSFPFFSLGSSFPFHYFYLSWTRSNPTFIMIVKTRSWYQKMYSNFLPFLQNSITTTATTATLFWKHKKTMMMTRYDNTRLRK